MGSSNKKVIFYKKESNSVIDLTDVEKEGYEAYEYQKEDEIIKYFDNNNIELDEELTGRLHKIIEKDEELLIGDFDIKTATSNRSFGELADMFDNDEIVVPELQRNFVWDSTRSSKLIESIILGLPIPPLFFLDVGGGKFEVIDGLQRLTTISNFINRKPWSFSKNNKISSGSSKLNSNVAESIKGKSFDNLDERIQKKIKRSTVTIIDFRQINKDNKESKYIIFERINTGSQVLTPMQIRKSLAHGTLISSLYEETKNIPDLLEIYGRKQISKDRGVELYLQTYFEFMVIVKRYQINKKYIKNALNDFCETYRDKQIEESFVERFPKALNNINKIFKPNEIFKKVDNNGFYGDKNLNIASMLLATYIKHFDEVEKKSIQQIREKYLEILSTNSENFSTNKINNDTILEKYEIIKQILSL